MADFAHGIQAQHPWGTPKQIPRNTCCWHEGVAELRHVGTMDPQWNGLSSRNTVVRASEWKGRQHQESIKAVHWWRSKLTNISLPWSTVTKTSYNPYFSCVFFKAPTTFSRTVSRQNSFFTSSNPGIQPTFFFMMGASVKLCGICGGRRLCLELTYWSSMALPFRMEFRKMACNTGNAKGPFQVMFQCDKWDIEIWSWENMIFGVLVVKDHLWSENTSDWLWNEVLAGSSFQKKTVPRWNDQTSKWQTVGGNRPSSHPLTHRCMFSRSTPQNVSSEIYQVWTSAVCLPDPLCRTSPICSQ